MAQHIMISFLSPFPKEYATNKLIKKISTYYGSYNFKTTGIQTNEPALDYIFKNYNPFGKYFFFSSDKVRGPLIECDDAGTETETTHAEYFKARTAQKFPSLKGNVEEVEYHEDNSMGYTNVAFQTNEADLNSIIAMAEKVRLYAEPYLKDSVPVYLHVDMTGGFRHASMLMLAVVELLKYSGIEIGRIIYTNYDVEKQTGKIEEINDIQEVMQLVAGAEAFVTFGSAEVMAKYFPEDGTSQELKNLINSMNNVADALKLCRSGVLPAYLRDLNNNIKAFEENINKVHLTSKEILFRQLLERIKFEYKEIISGTDNIKIIKWCLKKGFLQQALTFYTEWIPKIIVDNKIMYPAEKSIEKMCQAVALDYEPWQKALLTRFTASNIKSNFILKLRKYFKERNDDNKKSAFLSASDNGEHAQNVINEIEQNEQLVMEYKNNNDFLSSIKNKAPLLYGVIEGLYANEKNNLKIEYSLRDYWIQKLSQNDKIYNRLGVLPERVLKIYFTSPIKNETSTSALQIRNIKNIYSAEARRNILKQFLASGLLTTDINQQEALNICADYNKIRSLRNKINHAMAGTQIISTETIKAIIFDNIRRIENLSKGEKA